jgi:dephospho-CoA kinase
MLRVGLTGGLGSGKSTVARLFAAHGAHVLQSDTIGRELMEPGHSVYAAIVDYFG